MGTDGSKDMLQTVTVFPKEILAATACKFVSISRVSDQNGVFLLNIMLEIHHSGREHSNCDWIKYFEEYAGPQEVLSCPELLCSTVYLLKDILVQSLWRVSCNAKTDGW